MAPKRLQTTTKLRLMCSYGGRILLRPLPDNMSLYYDGGDTRIISVDRHTAASSLSSLVSFISRTIHTHRPFHLKYKLPNEDLDSLVSIINDEDFQNMLEVHDCIEKSREPSRIRFFLFPVKPEPPESWFSDALKSIRIDVRKADIASSFQDHDLIDLDGFSVPDLISFERSSSFGSGSSWNSMGNFEDAAVNLRDKKYEVPSTDSNNRYFFDSDQSVANVASISKTGIYQKPLTEVSSGASSDTTRWDSFVSNPPVYYDHRGATYERQYLTGPLQISSYYPMCNPAPPTYAMPMQCNLVNSASRSALNPYNATINPPADYKKAIAARMMTDSVFHRTAPNTKQQQFGHPPEPVATASVAASDHHEFDLAHAEIYKTQPPTPLLHPRYLITT